VFSLGNTDGNASGGTYVAYCFAPVAGYSAFGSYTGNGSSNDGTFVFTGFRPRFVMVKAAINNTGPWEIIDTSRILNGQGVYLRASNSNAEAVDNSLPTPDILSNGFKPRSLGGGFNDTNVIYVYAAFAEHPFKYALAR
jgi:hypothetical protein